MKHALLVQDAKVFGLFEKFVQLCNKRATCATWHIKILQPSDSPSVEEGPSGGGANTGGGTFDRFYHLGCACEAIHEDHQQRLGAGVQKMAFFRQGLQFIPKGFFPCSI